MQLRSSYMLLSLAFGAGILSAQPNYSFQSIDVPLPGASGTTAIGINAEGQIVGRFMIGKATHAFLLDSGQYTTFDDPEILPTAPVTYASGINPAGFISGYYLDPPDGTDIPELVTSEMGMDFDMSGDPPPSTRLRSFLRSPLGDFTPIDFPASQVPSSYPTDGFVQTMAIHISANGTVVGCFHHFGSDFDHTMHGFVYRDGEYTFYPLAGTMHNGVSPDGRTIVGVWYPDLTHFHSYVISDGVYTQFDPPGAVISAAWDVNPRGEIVGNYADTAGHMHGYVLYKGNFVTVNFPGAIMTQLRGVNPRGDAVGFYADPQGHIHGFVALKAGRS